MHLDLFLLYTKCKFKFVEKRPYYYCLSEEYILFGLM